MGCRLDHDCWVANYQDRTDGAARDFAGGAITYPKHDGTDFLVNGFTAMDQGVDVYAAAEGVVTEAVDGSDDRCTSGTCPGLNGVALLHADGVVVAAVRPCNRRMNSPVVPRAPLMWSE